MASKYCDRADVCKMRGWCATDFNPESGCEFFEPETNGDRIRAMSDEELAEFHSGQDVRYGCAPNVECIDDCTRCWLDWLKSPAEVEKCQS